MVETQLADTNPWSPQEHGFVDWTSPLRIGDNNSSYGNSGDDKALASNDLEQGQNQEHTSKSGTQKLGLRMDPALNLSTSTLIEPLDENIDIRNECKLQLVLQQVTHGKELIDQRLARTESFLEVGQEG
ncbi:hypothetical protein BGZ82_007903 [Podila clonocystis]|nr:hypothetical protein BGZ82_007903 [Podila clonocystis]